MSRLAGKFAGIVLVTVVDGRLEALVADLTALNDQGRQVVIERTADPGTPTSQRLSLELHGADHPGIVAEISASLATRNVSIEELSTEVREAPMSGGTLFEARAVLNAPSDADTEGLRSLLESLANELMVDIVLSDD